MNDILKNKIALITGIAGFIGYNLAIHLIKLNKNITIVGIDNINDYYDVSLKEWRLKAARLNLKAYTHGGSSLCSRRFFVQKNAQNTCLGTI